MIRDFSLKFIDIMIGVILGLGFQWWPNLHEAWQYIAFIFVYIDIVDYWIDYEPALKKFPPRNEIELLLDVGIMFSLFLFIYATQLSILYFLVSFILFRVVDTLWLVRVKFQYQPTHTDKVFVDTWTRFNVIEIAAALLMAILVPAFSIEALPILIGFIVFRTFMRVLASFQYKKVHFA